MFHLLYSGTNKEKVCQWCYDLIYSGNNVLNVNNNLLVYQSNNINLVGNWVKIKGLIEIEIQNSTGYIVKIISNTIENTTPAIDLDRTFAFALTNATSDTIGSFEIYNNTVKTTLPYQDDNQTTSVNMLSVVTAANSNATHADNNVIVFSDATKRQKILFGDLLNVPYYLGLKGAVTYNNSTLRLTIKPTDNRTDTDYITFTT
jgi:hypothetical protein